VENEDNRYRIIIESVKPEINAGRFPAKRIIGDTVIVEADIFADGHDTLSALLLYRKREFADWVEVPMEHQINDRWRASFDVTELGEYVYTITAWVDRYQSWRHDLEKRVNSGSDNISINLEVGLHLINETVERMTGNDADMANNWTKTLRSKSVGQNKKVDIFLSAETSELMAKYSDRRFAVTYPRELVIVVDPEIARFSTWYEMFPRSKFNNSDGQGNFKDCEDRLPYIAAMGFDVLYFPPIHPIGLTNRKGKNNSVKSEPGDPGTPWAIGSEEGGHKAIHPELGKMRDFQNLVKKAKKYGIEIALDIAFQCSPDHPYVRQHPEWFLWRPDGTIQYAENPPKKYQDIYPLNFENEQWKELWEELKSIIIFWIEKGIRIFRIDNPHTKPFVFWEWIISEVKKSYPNVIFLAEAFTRPKVMYQLAKLGFTQSYTYFTWRNTKWELTQYFTELTGTDVHEFFRPNLWPNTPDILTDYLVAGGRPAFMARLALAATLGSSYGIYGPAFELLENRPKGEGTEEYMDSEKYEIKHWDINKPDSLKDFIEVVNKVRRENKALQSNSNLHFHDVDNDQLICFSKHTDDMSNTVLVVVNLDPYHTHSGWIELSPDILKFEPGRPYQMHDKLSGARFLWYGQRNYVELNPFVCPAHIFVVRKHLRTERDFDYFM